MRVNIIGRAEGFEEGLTASGERWGINYWRPELDILFDIHNNAGSRDIDNAKAAGTEVILQDDYPLAQITQHFGTDYFGSSVDWLIAYAIYLYYSCSSRKQVEIHLYGVAMDDRGDHYEMRCATDFWCGVAIGRGIKVVVHGNSTVMTTPDGTQYGTFKPMSRRYVSNNE